MTSDLECFLRLLCFSCCFCGVCGRFPRGRVFEGEDAVCGGVDALGETDIRRGPVLSFLGLLLLFFF